MLIHPHQMEDVLAQINADHPHFHMGSSVNRLLHDLPLPAEDQAADHPIKIGQTKESAYRSDLHGQKAGW